MNEMIRLAISLVSFCFFLILCVFLLQDYYYIGTLLS